VSEVTFSMFERELATCVSHSPANGCLCNQISLSLRSEKSLKQGGFGLSYFCACILFGVFVGLLLVKRTQVL